MPAVQKQEQAVTAVRGPALSSAATTAATTSQEVSTGSDAHSGVNYEALRLWGCGLWTWGATCRFCSGPSSRTWAAWRCPPQTPQEYSRASACPLWGDCPPWWIWKGPSLCWRKPKTQHSDTTAKSQHSSSPEAWGSKTGTQSGSSWLHAPGPPTGPAALTPAEKAAASKWGKKPVFFKFITGQRLIESDKKKLLRETYSGNKVIS